MENRESKPPPRFFPDNSLEARERRIKAHQYTLAKVVEVPHKHILPTDGDLPDNVVYLPKPNPNPPDIAA